MEHRVLIKIEKHAGSSFLQKTLYAYILLQNLSTQQRDECELFYRLSGILYRFYSVLFV